MEDRVDLSLGKKLKFLGNLSYFLYDGECPLILAADTLTKKEGKIFGNSGFFFLILPLGNSVS